LRARLTGLHFDSDRTFLLPAAIPHLRQVVSLQAARLGSQVLVVGHADKQNRSASAARNRLLSENRAKAIAAFLLNHIEDWFDWYGAGRDAYQRWGVREDQLMLVALPEEGPPFYTGAVDGDPGPKTQEALRGFQRSKSLDADGKAGPQTRRALIESYMALSGTSLPETVPVATHGCGDTHPEVDAPGAEIRNRRVDIYLFSGDPKPPPQTPCPDGGCAEHAQWVQDSGAPVDIEHALGSASVRVIDELEHAVPGVSVHLTGPSPADGKSDGDGRALFPVLVRGEYTILARKEGFLPGRSQARVGGEPSGGERVAADDGITVQLDPAILRIQLDEPGIEAGASEASRSWAQNELFITQDGARKTVQLSPAGEVLLPDPGAAAPLLLDQVIRPTGGGLPELWWRTVPDTGATVTNGMKIELHTRLRNSIWTAAGFLVGNHKDARGRSVTPPVAQRLKQLEDGLAMVDDISVYDTHSVKLNGSDLMLVKDEGHSISEADYGQFVTGLHGVGIQVHAGLRILGAAAAGPIFLKWLRNADPAAMDRFASNVLDTLSTSGFDGLGLDFEFGGLVLKDTAKLTDLLHRAAVALGTKHKVLTIAAGVFGVGASPFEEFQKAQPPEMAQGVPNIIFRPMSYKSNVSRGGAPEADSVSQDRIKKCLDHLLAKAKLHPNQVQMGINESGDPGGWVSGMSGKLMTDIAGILRTRRAGSVYWLLGALDPPTARLEAIEQALNPGEAPPGSMHQPLQAPLAGKKRS
jgi:outer membrane protein OmpA-like peptidoglycan-associated protein